MTATTTPVRTMRMVRPMWQTPVFTTQLPGAETHNPTLRDLILAAEAKDPGAANFGGIDATKSCSDILRWDHSSIHWLKEALIGAVWALTRAELGEATAEVTHGILAEGWAVVYRSGGSLRPHTHHDSAWSGVYYVESGAGDDAAGRDAGHLQLLDPRPAAIARQASTGPTRIEPVPGRLVAFPGWEPHQVAATLSGSGLRIAIAFNIAYEKD